MPGSVFDEVADEGEAPYAPIDVCAELGIERDAPFQQERRHGLVLEAARDCERLSDDGQIVSVFIERGANGVDVTERRKELERARKQALALKQCQQPSGARLKDAFADRWRHDRARIDEQLGARPARKIPLPLRVPHVKGVGARRHSEQAAAFLVGLPREQRRVFS